MLWEPVLIKTTQNMAIACSTVKQHSACVAQNVTGIQVASMIVKMKKQLASVSTYILSETTRLWCIGIRLEKSVLETVSNNACS